MTSSFSPNGELIAFHCTSYMRSNHEIIVMRVKNMQIIHTLIGHLSIIYGIDWLDEQTLVSVSSDRTAIIWKLADNNSFALKVKYYRFVFLFSLPRIFAQRLIQNATNLQKFVFNTNYILLWLLNYSHLK